MPAAPTRPRPPLLLRCQTKSRTLLRWTRRACSLLRGVAVGSAAAWGPARPPPAPPPPLQGGRAARSHFEARQGRPRPRLARPVVSRAHSVVVAQLIQWPTAFCLSAFCRLCTRCTDRLLQLAQIEAPPHSLHTCVSAVVPHAANFLGESVLLRAVTAVPIPSRARPSACMHYAATGRLDGASSGDSS